MNALIFAILLASASLAQDCTLAIQGVDPEGAHLEVKITSITRFDDPGEDFYDRVVYSPSLTEVGALCSPGALHGVELTQ